MHAEHSTIQKLFQIKSEIQEVYWNLVIQTFAKSLIGIFLPLYFLTIGFSLTEAVAFAFIYFASLTIFSPLSGRLTARVGYKHQILYQE